ncbi:MAG: flagellar filament capping protein FliD [Acutalibacter sp.]|nr:flagellar filament capping protein FliD [Acutalibacter sp.]
MASITSLMNSSSSTSSLYGNRNVISGLASGMDTEAMIENSVAGYKQKITGLQQKMTKLQWKQDAYRSLITQMNNMLNKYMSYTSSTNLFSSSFFSKAVNAVAGGANASKVAVTGKGSSNVQIDSIKQLAQAASYSVNVEHLVSKGSQTSEIKWNDPIETSSVSGSITFQLGGAADSSKGTRFTLRFEEDEVYKTTDELVEAVNKKLENLQINGKSASTLVKAVNDGDKIKFEKSTGDHLEIAGVGGDMTKLFEKDEESGKYSMTSNAIGTGKDQVALFDSVKRTDYLKEQSINVTLDGKTKTIKLADIIDTDEFRYKAGAYNEKASEALADMLQQRLDKEFGAGKITVGEDGGALQFSAKSGSTLKVGGDDKVNEALGLGQGGYSNTVQTSWTLDRVLDDNMFHAKQAVDEDGNVIAGKWIDVNGKETDDINEAAQVATLKINGVDIELNKNDTIQNMMDKIGSSDAGVEVKYSSLTGEFAFTAKETGVDSRIEIEGDVGKVLFGGDPSKKVSSNFNEAYGLGLNPGESKKVYFKVDGLGRPYGFNVNEGDTMEDVAKRLSQLMTDAGDGKSASVNQYTGQLEITDNETGALVDMKVGEMVPDLDRPKPGGGYYVKFEEKYDAPENSSVQYTRGQDAIFDVTVNGKQMQLTRSSNNVDLDGYNVTLKETFGYKADGTQDTSADPITFKTNTDSDKIVDAIKDFVKDYNELVTALRGAYTTEPLKNSQKEEYQPLTDEDQAKMSETAIKNYEEKAKTGLLYADTDLANLYSKLTSAVQGSGGLSSTLRSIGLDVSYSNNLTTLSLDEDKLRAALESDPDKVKDAFTQTTSNGASTNGIMANLRSTLQSYASTSIGSPGILVNKAGSTLSSYSLNNNELNDQINAIQEEIEKWQSRMSDRVDYYTNQFTQLEMLINQMNSQSSMLAGLSGGM